MDKGQQSHQGEFALIKSHVSKWRAPQICIMLFYKLLIYPARARAVTGRRCPHSGKGEDFLSRQPDFFTETAVTSGTESQKIVPMVGN